MRIPVLRVNTHDEIQTGKTIVLPRLENGKFSHLGELGEEVFQDGTEQCFTYLAQSLVLCLVGPVVPGWTTPLSPNHTCPCKMGNKDHLKKKKFFFNFLIMTTCVLSVYDDNHQ